MQKLLRNRQRPSIGGIDSQASSLSEPFSKLTFGGACIQKLLLELGGEFDSVLDIGSGEGEHADIFRKFGKEVTEVDFGNSEYFQHNSCDREVLFGDYMKIELGRSFDLVWACHVLEHQLNVNLFLRKVASDLKEGGLLAITVPPLKHEIVGGHVTLWNGGLLMYNIVLAGMDCREAKILQYGYNISLIVQKRMVALPALSYDKGDVALLAEFFPPGVSEPFDGNISEMNWWNNR